MKLNTALAAWLLDHGASVAARGCNNLTPGWATITYCPFCGQTELYLPLLPPSAAPH